MDKKDSKYCGCLYYTANALARIMTKRADAAFAITGLTSSYAFLIMTVNDKPGIQAQEISNRMMLSPSTITRLIEKMEYKNLLARRTNGKYTEVYPTEAGLKIGITIKEAWKGLKTGYSEVLGEERAIQITHDINECVKTLDS